MKYTKTFRKKEPRYDATRQDGVYLFREISDVPDQSYDEKLRCKECEKEFVYDTMVNTYACPYCNSKNVRPRKMLRLHDYTQQEVAEATRISWERGQYPPPKSSVPSGDADTNAGST